jgi:hypothetical protein
MSNHMEAKISARLRMGVGTIRIYLQLAVEINIWLNKLICTLGRVETSLIMIKGCKQDNKSLGKHGSYYIQNDKSISGWNLDNMSSEYFYRSEYFSLQGMKLLHAATQQHIDGISLRLCKHSAGGG